MSLLSPPSMAILTSDAASLHAANLSILTYSIPSFTIAIHYISTQPKPVIHLESIRSTPLSASITNRFRIWIRLFLWFTDR